MRSRRPCWSGLLRSRVLWQWLSLRWLGHLLREDYRRQPDSESHLPSAHPSEGRTHVPPRGRRCPPLSRSRHQPPLHAQRCATAQAENRYQRDRHWHSVAHPAPLHAVHQPLHAPPSHAPPPHAAPSHAPHCSPEATRPPPAG
eukprot:scaffold4357_cov113-Isochrysis_galbana.AAC.25